MSSSSADHSPPADEGPRHAGFLVRLAAGLLDILIMGIPVLLVASIVLSGDAGEIVGFDLEYTDANGETQTNRIPLSASDLVQMAVLAVATVWMWVNWDGRTPGKKITRTRVVTHPGYGPLSYRTSTVRLLVAVASSLPLLLGYVVISLMIALRGDKRGYHDLIAGTCVVHDR